MRIFDLPQKDLEKSFIAILDYTEKSIDQWENLTTKSGAFSEFEPTAIIKKPITLTGQNKTEATPAKSAFKIRLNWWQSLGIYTFLMVIFLLFFISAIIMLGL